MKWFWLFMATTTAISLLQSDAHKLRKWHERDEKDLVVDRIASMLALAFAAWRIYVEW